LGLGRFILLWYSAAAILFLVVAGIGGAVIFSLAGAGIDIWLWPWIALCAVAALQFVVSPFNYLMEGLGQIARVARMRWFSMPCHSVATWVLIAGGANLWTPVGSMTAILAVNLGFLLIVFPKFFYQLLAAKSAGSIDWRREIWPMQWRLGIQGAVNYLFYSLFNPVLFYYQGPAEAGRFGMTLQILGGIQSAGLSWLQSVIPDMGRLVAQRKIAEMNRIWLRATKYTVSASLLGNGAFLLSVPVLAAIAPAIATRFCDTFTVAVLALAYWLLQPLQCMAAYMRSFKREALTWISFASGISCGALVWFLGSTYGSLGAAVALLAVTALLTLPGATFVWMRAKKSWHLELGVS
jgi:O-antigen/teichoic acid export membrane protein